MGFHNFELTHWNEGAHFPNPAYHGGKCVTSAPCSMLRLFGFSDPMEDVTVVMLYTLGKQCEGPHVQPLEDTIDCDCPGGSIIPMLRKGRFLLMLAATPSDRWAIWL